MNLNYSKFNKYVLFPLSSFDPSFRTREARIVISSVHSLEIGVLIDLCKEFLTELVLFTEKKVCKLKHLLRFHLGIVTPKHIHTRLRIIIFYFCID